MNKRYDFKENDSCPLCWIGELKYFTEDCQCLSKKYENIAYCTSCKKQEFICNNCHRVLDNNFDIGLFQAGLLDCKTRNPFKNG